MNEKWTGGIFVFSDVTDGDWRGVSAIRCFLLDTMFFLAEVIEFWNLENTGNYSRNAPGQILKFPRGISEFGSSIFSENFFKLSAKFISTLILKISWKNIEKCKSLSVLSERVLCKKRKSIYGHFCPFLEVF